MKEFLRLQFDPDQCLKELAEFQSLLAAYPNLEESREIRPFFQERNQLSAFLGAYDSDIARYDLLAYEYDLFGDFACDLVVGDSVTKTYGLIEFEDAKQNSVFVRKRAKATPEWSPRFDHGFSQIIDWFYRLDDAEKTDEFDARFGARSVNYFGLLVIGRSEGFAARELRRLAWRQDKTVVNSRRIRCVTFDQLAESLGRRLHFRTLTAETGDSDGPASPSPPNTPLPPTGD